MNDEIIRDQVALEQALRNDIGARDIRIQQLERELAAIKNAAEHVVNEYRREFERGELPDVDALEDALSSAVQTPAKPVAWRYRVNDSHTNYDETEPPDDAYDEGTLVALYDRPAPEPPADVIYGTLTARDPSNVLNTLWTDTDWWKRANEPPPTKSEGG